jgi:hypothetical protein
MKDKQWRTTAIYARGRSERSRRGRISITPGLRLPIHQCLETGKFATSAIIGFLEREASRGGRASQSF